MHYDDDGATLRDLRDRSLQPNQAVDRAAWPGGELADKYFGGQLGGSAAVQRTPARAETGASSEAESRPEGTDEQPPLPQCDPRAREQAAPLDADPWQVAPEQEPAAWEPADAQPTSAGHTQSVPPGPHGSRNGAGATLEPVQRRAQGRLNLSELAPRRPAQTRSKWRRLFHMGPSAAELAEQERLDRLQQPLHGQTFIGASVQIKGGDGKTTSAILTAEAIAENTGHHVVVVSADPANGNLLERLVDFPNEGELMRHPTAIDLYEAEMAARAQGRIGLTDASEIGRFLALAGRLRGLGGRQIVQDDDDGDSGLTAEQVKVITECLSRVFDVIIFDCGTDLTTAAAKVILGQADALVVVANPTWDTLRKGEQSLDSIEYRRPELPPRSMIGLIHTEPAGATPTTFQLGETLSRLGSRVASITEIPYDPWIRGGTAILWDRLQPETRNAAFDLAGHCADVWSRLGSTAQPEGPSVRFQAIEQHPGVQLSSGDQAQRRPGRTERIH